MQELFHAAILAYVEMLEIHIDTKTGNEPFHRKTEEFYEWLFDIAHDIWERYVDLWWQLREDSGNCEVQANKVVEILTLLKSKLEEVEWVSKGTENLIYNHLDKLEFMIWSAMWFTHKMEWKGKSSELPWLVVEIETSDEEAKEKEEPKEEPKEESKGDMLSSVEWIISM